MWTLSRRVAESKPIAQASIAPLSRSCTFVAIPCAPPCEREVEPKIGNVRHRVQRNAHHKSPPNPTSKSSRKSSKIDPESPPGAPWGPKGCPDAPQERQRAPKERQKHSQGAPGSAPGAPRERPGPPPESPGEPKGAPGSAKRRPGATEIASKSPPERKSRLCGNPVFY